MGWKGRSFVISALAGEGCRELVFAIAEHLEREARPGDQRPAKPRRARGAASVA
jgi:GTP-binding protein